MLRLLAYGATIYDANCIIYYCFRTDERRSGAIIVLEYEFTEKVREITKRLVEANKTILTIKLAWEEVLRVATAKVVDEFLSRDNVHARLGLLQGAKVPAELKLKLTKNLNKKIRALRYQRWFYIEPAFSAKKTDLEAVRDLFRALASNPANHARFRPGKNPIPSDVDISLILYSAKRGAPLLTNDSGIYEFDPELRAASFCAEIRALPSVAF